MKIEKYIEKRVKIGYNSEKFSNNMEKTSIMLTLAVVLQRQTNAAIMRLYLRLLRLFILSLKISVSDAKTETLMFLGV